MDGDISRRTFLVATAATAAVAVVPVVLASPAGALSRIAETTSTPLQRSLFTPLVGQTFTMSARRDAISVVLSEVADLKPATAAKDEARFSLLFTAPGREARPQGTYQLQHPKLGSVALFVVPIDRGASARRYQAIINRRP
jgi:hypothetical protein